MTATSNPYAVWDAAEDGWNPVTNPQPLFRERRSLPRCAACGGSHEGALSEIPAAVTS